MKRLIARTAQHEDTHQAIYLIGFRSSLCRFGSKAGPGRIWITDATIVSADNLDHIEKASVLIEDGRIVTVDRSLKAKKPAGSTLVDGRGQ